MAKKRIAFLCVHNSCRSQIAEALGRHLAGDRFDFYSAGTETRPRINQDAVRLMKQLYGIDMEKSQYSKTIDQIPTPDLIISMGCDWQLPDPTGQSDQVFLDVIRRIHRRIETLVNTPQA